LEQVDSYRAIFETGGCSTVSGKGIRSRPGILRGVIVRRVITRVRLCSRFAKFGRELMRVVCRVVCRVG